MESGLQSDDLPQFEVYTDGGCRPNPSPGGWAAIIRPAAAEAADDRPAEWYLSGNHPDTTNNQMELQAAISALAFLTGLLGRCVIDLYTDSEYMRQGITEWLPGWERNGWKTRGREPVKNQQLWRQLDRLAQNHTLNWHWLRSHADHPHNERADQMATRARRALTSPAAAPPAALDQAQPAEVSVAVKASYNAARRMGGWGVVLRKGEHVRTLSRAEPRTSANALLLRAAAEGLCALHRPCAVLVLSDAEYLIRGASQWVRSWQARDWRTKAGQPVANRPEWEALLVAAEPHRVHWQLARPEDTVDLALAGELAAAAEPDEPAAADPPADP
jgi:ribonuclease HI